MKQKVCCQESAYHILGKESVIGIGHSHHKLNVVDDDMRNVI